MLAVDVEEQRQPDELPAEYVQRLARDKSQAPAGWACGGQKPVLGADTIVVFEQKEVLEKPRDFADAQRILQLLSGNTHTVMTAVALSSELDCEVYWSVRRSRSVN